MGLLSFLNPLEAITKALAAAYAARENAKTDAARLRVEQDIAELQARRDVQLSAASDPWWSPRSIMGWSVAAYVGKIIVWDTVLGLGVTVYPGDQVTAIVMTVIGFYFASKAVEGIAATAAAAFGRRGK
jgi:hypothetical protein